MAHTRSSPQTSAVTAGIHQAQSLIQQRRLPEARQLLTVLDHKHPNHSDVLLGLAQLCEQMQDWPALVGVGERLVCAHPRDPDLLFSLGKAYRHGGHLALALRTFRRFLTEHPQHQSAPDASDEVAELAEFFAQEIAGTGLPADDAMSALELADEASSLGAQRRYADARKIAEQLVSRFPRFAFGLTSLAQLHWAEGSLAQALLITDRALEVAPDNIHVHARRVKALCVLGRIDEARRHEEKLAAVPIGGQDEEISRAEAHSYLGNDQAVIQEFQRTTAPGQPPLVAKAGIFCHLVAVAELRLGHEAEAADLWNRALRLLPTLEIARQNVADRYKPRGEQQAPWPFSMAMWIPERTLDDLNRAMQGRQSAEELRQRARHFLVQHPEIVALIPVLLDRGDPPARTLAFTLARIAKTEELLLALRDFALSTRGPDLMRNQAAYLAIEAGLLPWGPLRLWLRGEWHEIVPFDFEWNAEPARRLPPKPERLLEESLKELTDDNPQGAERLLREALAIESDSPLLFHTLAAVLSAQRRNFEADALLDSIHQRFPDFVAAVSDIARRHLRRGEVDQAEALLKPLLARKRFEGCDFACLCIAQIEVLLARRDRAPLSIWLQMWEQATPDHAALEPYRKRVEQAGTA